MNRQVIIQQHNNEMLNTLTDNIPTLLTLANGCLDKRFPCSMSSLVSPWKCSWYLWQTNQKDYRPVIYKTNTLAAANRRLLSLGKFMCSGV